MWPSKLRVHLALACPIAPAAAHLLLLLKCVLIVLVEKKSPAHFVTRGEYQNSQSLPDRARKVASCERLSFFPCNFFFFFFLLPLVPVRSRRGKTSTVPRRIGARSVSYPTTIAEVPPQTHTLGHFARYLPLLRLLPCKYSYCAACFLLLVRSCRFCPCALLQVTYWAIFASLPHTPRAVELKSTIFTRQTPPSIVAASDFDHVARPVIFSVRLICPPRRPFLLLPPTSASSAVQRSLLGHSAPFLSSTDYTSIAFGLATLLARQPHPQRHPPARPLRLRAARHHGRCRCRDRGGP